MVKQEILDNYFPEYRTLNRILDKYSEYELGLLEEYPKDINDLEEEILKEVQWDILCDVISEYIDEEFYHNFEMELMEYFLDNGNLFINHDATCNSYCLSDKNITFDEFGNALSRISEVTTILQTFKNNYGYLIIFKNLEKRA